MANLFGKSITRKDLELRVSRMAQVAGIRQATLEEGREAGVKVAEVHTGSGLNFTIALSRALDLYNADFCGRSLCWHSPLGIAHPAFYEPAGLGWLRTFGGGLMTTCGLTSLGSPTTDEGEALGLHGRISTIPADKVKIREGWVGEKYEMSVEGEMVEAFPVVGDHLRLTRKITAFMGESKILISDKVENFGYKTVPHMILYHINTGWPLLDESSRLLSPSRKVTPRDAEAEKEAGKFAEALPPIAGFSERVYAHELGEDKQGRRTVALVNPKLDACPEQGRGDGLALSVSFLAKQLPRFAQWKMCAAGNYVMGLEPANCWVDGRAQHRSRGDLQFLEAGEVRNYDLEFEIVSGKSALAELEKTISAMG
jgi:hypothetical protein